MYVQTASYIVYVQYVWHSDVPSSIDLIGHIAGQFEHSKTVHLTVDNHRIQLSGQHGFKSKNTTYY